MEPGEIVGGKYVIERLLGKGGMGAVYLARQDRLDRRVAIKFLHADGDASPEAHARFAREARAAAVLESEHVTRVIDVGHTDDGAPYMVMEYLQGEDLSAALERRGPLPVAQVIDAVIQACDAIGEAHQRGIVHRDLKPANIFIAQRSNGTSIVKVLDFGISKAHGPAAGVALTTTSALVGSPLYMSPEQIREARTVDGRADIWAIGVILYELLTGATPFQSQAFGELCALIITAEPRPVRALRPDASPTLEAIVHRCLQKDPGARFANVADLVAALRVAERIPAGTPAPPFSAPQPMSAPLASAARTGDGLANTRVSSHPPRSRAALVAGIVGVAGIAIAATFAIRRVRTEPVLASPAATSALVGYPSAPPAPQPAPLPSPEPARSASPAPPVPVVAASSIDSSSPAPPAASVQPPTPKKRSSGGGRAEAPSTPSSKAPVVDCKVPYVFDASGNKHFKPECL